MLTDGEEGPIQKITESAKRKLTKTDLIEEVSRVTELQWHEAAVIVERILDSMVRAIERGDKVEIRGFVVEIFDLPPLLWRDFHQWFQYVT
jgi:hypothetical protein